MAKGKTRNLRGQKAKSSVKRTYPLRFIFQGSGESSISEEYVESIRNKIKPENSNRAEILLIQENQKLPAGSLLLLGSGRAGRTRRG
jgi:hypothetical protein